MYSIRALVATVLFLFSYAAHADSEIARFSKSGSSIFVIAEKGNTSKIRLAITITNWQIDCAKTRAVIWGKTLKKLPAGVAPYTKFYVVNILKKRVLNSYTRTLRVHGLVEFDKAGEIIVVDEDVIDFKTGMLKQVELPANSETQTCEDFQGRRSH
jgi:hypothetical protein